MNIAKFFHQKIVPGLYALMWFFGLLFSINSEKIFDITNGDIIHVVSLVIIFSIFFLELIVMLMDLYSVATEESFESGETRYISIKFIPIVCIVLFIILSLFVYIIIYIIQILEHRANDVGQVIIWILVASTILKYIELFVQNNKNKYINSYKKLETSKEYKKRNLKV